MVRYPALLSGLIVLALAAPANAEVTRFKVLERTASALQGRGFGATCAGAIARSQHPGATVRPELCCRLDQALEDPIV